MPLKEQHEIAIANQLLGVLGLDSKFIRHGIDGKEPDVIYSINGHTVGIEVATAYCSEKQATEEWQVARGISKVADIGVIENPRKLMEARVQREIDDKCAKIYSGVDQTWLCIEQHLPAFFDVAETEEYLPRLRVPTGCPFERLYLGFHAHTDDGGGFRVFNLAKIPLPSQSNHIQTDSVSNPKR